MSKRKKKNKRNQERNYPVVQPVKKKKIEFIPLEKKTKYLTLLIFISLAFILYFQCLFFGFVLDDKIVLTDNAYTKNGLNGLWDLFTTESFQGYFGEQKNLLQGGRYRPLSLMTFAIEHQFFGLNSAISHHVNILLYGLSGFVSFITLRGLFTEKTFAKNALFSLSFIASIIFIAHPIHTEAVANIKGRDEILSFLFSMLSLHQAIKFFDKGKLINLFLMVLCFFLGILSKENTITFLAIIPFALILFRNKSKKRILQIGFALVLTSIAYLVLRFNIIGYLVNENPSTDIMNNPFYGLSSNESLSTVLYTLLIYLKLNFFPHPLTHDYYPYHIPILNFGSIWVWLSIILHFIMGVLVFYYWKRRPKIAFAIGFYLAAMSIVSNLGAGSNRLMISISS